MAELPLKWIKAWHVAVVAVGAWLVGFTQGNYNHERGLMGLLKPSPWKTCTSSVACAGHEACVTFARPNRSDQSLGDGLCLMLSASTDNDIGCSSTNLDACLHGTEKYLERRGVEQAPGKP